MDDVAPPAESFALQARLRHLVRVEAGELRPAARESLVRVLMRREDPSSIRRDFLELVPQARRVEHLETMLATGHPVLQRLRAARFDPEQLLGSHELVTSFIRRTVARCLAEDGLQSERLDDVCEAFIDALGSDLGAIQKRILMHPRPDRIVHLGRFLKHIDLGPARRAYLEVTGLAPETSVVGYVEWALNGTTEQQRTLVRWEAFSETHLLLCCGVSVPTTAVPKASIFSALELMERNTEPRQMTPLEGDPWDVLEEPAFFVSTRHVLAFPLIDAVLISMARPVLGVDRCWDVLVPPDEGVRPSDGEFRRARASLGSWVHVDDDTFGRWLGAAPSLAGLDPAWALVWARLLRGLERLRDEAGSRPLGFRTLAAAWLRESLLGEHPLNRHRGSGGEFVLNPIESALDQQLMRLLVRQGRHPRELLRWMLAEWPEASDALRSLARESGVDGSGIVPILHGLDGARSLGAEKKAVTVAGRQAWCLVDVDVALERNAMERSDASGEVRRLPSEPWGAKAVTGVDGAYEPELLAWP